MAGCRHSSQSGGPSIDLSVLGGNSYITSPDSTAPPTTTTITTFPPSSPSAQFGSSQQSPRSQFDEWETDHRPVVSESTSTFLPGWPLLADAMTTTPSIRAVARFQKLNVKTLLYYQVELADLEEQLKETEDKDYKAVATDGAHNFAENASSMITRKVEDETQWDLVLRIRRTLKEYNEAILQYTQISRLPAPQLQNMKSLSNWLENPDKGSNQVVGSGSKVWKVTTPKRNKYEMIRDMLSSIPGFKLIFRRCYKEGETAVAQSQTEDLVSLEREDRADPLSLWIAHKFWPFYWEFTGEDEKTLETAGEESGVSGEGILKFTAGLATMVACTMPIAGIAILAKVEPMGIRIGIIAAFSFIMSGALLLLARCKRMDVFMATAAFSAVLVVFVQNA